MQGLHHHDEPEEIVRVVRRRAGEKVARELPASTSPQHAQVEVEGGAGAHERQRVGARLLRVEDETLVHGERRHREDREPPALEETARQRIRERDEPDPAQERRQAQRERAGSERIDRDTDHDVVERRLALDRDDAMPELGPALARHGPPGPVLVDPELVGDQAPCAQEDPEAEEAHEQERAAALQRDVDSSSKVVISASRMN